MLVLCILLVIIILHAMKANKFEEIITSAIARVKPTLTGPEGQAFQQMISALPKRIKEFNAEPYLFIFEAMLRRKELVQHALSAFAVMLEENYITSAMYDRLAGSLSPLMKEHSYAAVQAILRIKEPHLQFFRLYFEVYTNVALPEDLLRKFKAVGYGWLARAFDMTQRELPQFQASVYAKFYPQEMPRLVSPEEQEREVRKYVGLVLQQAVQAVEERLQGGRVKRGKHGCCFLCKQPADYYCKDTRVPVCGVDCKKAHLELLARSNALNGHYPASFLRTIEQLLISNLQRRVSPAISIDFLVAIYCFSSYIPQCQLPHARALILPVIYERTWMLYLAYFGKKKQLCQHIFASCLTVQESFVRNVATDYFLRLVADPRFLRVYAGFDRAGRGRLTDFLLRSLEEGRRGQFVQVLVATLFNAYSRSKHVYEHSEAALVRAFNHEKDLSSASLKAIFGEDAEQKLIALILRNELAINREKLGQFLYSNEGLLKLFLAEIVRLKAGAPIDQLLREIFYYINVKISDKIYRLFELLSEVYTPTPPFDQMNFFTYAYFVIMIVTELNNPAVTVKPTLASVLTRVEQFSPILAKQHREIVEAMFERVSAFPFSQGSRGILSHYPSVKDVGVGQGMRPEEVVVENNELIYEIVIACAPDVLLLYRLCCLVANYPAICQVFLQLLVDKLQEQPRDGFLIQAISLVVQQQPNAAGCLWRQILEDKPGPGEPFFSVQQLVQASPLLTDGNFKQFVRQLCQQLPLTSAGEHYITLLSLNHSRVSLAVPLLISNYDKCSNYYLKLAFIKRFGQFLQSFADECLCGFMRRMIEDLPILPITEGLLVQSLTSVRLQVLGPAGEACWRALGKKCLQMRGEKTGQVLEGYLRKGGEQFYESYLIQKTLNCCKKEHISSQILKNLNKLEPYIKQIRPDLLQMFVLEDNMEVIMRFFEFFSRFNATYQLLLDKWANQPEWFDQEKINAIVESLQSLFEGEDAARELLPLSNVPKVIVKLLAAAGKTIFPLLRKYLQAIKFKQVVENQWFPQQNAMNIVHFNILAQSLNHFISEVGAELKERREEGQKEQINELLDILHSMHEQARSFQINIPLRFEIRRLLRLTKPQAPLPSLLDSSILILKAAFSLEDILQHPNQPSLMRIFHTAEAVIEHQSKRGQIQAPPPKRDSPQRIALLQANKDALRYGQLAIETAYEYLQLKGDLSGQDKATMKRILISILIQGYFNEETGSFQSLAGSELARKVQEVFHLIK